MICQKIKLFARNLVNKFLQRKAGFERSNTTSLRIVSLTLCFGLCVETRRYYRTGPLFRVSTTCKTKHAASSVPGLEEGMCPSMACFFMNRNIQTRNKKKKKKKKKKKSTITHSIYT